MEETIMAVLAAGGVIGIAANYLVAGAKWIAAKKRLKIHPRVLVAVFSLASALAVVATGGEADMTAISDQLTVIIVALVSGLTAHFTHKVNEV